MSQMLPEEAGKGSTDRTQQGRRVEYRTQCQQIVTNNEENMIF